MASNKSELGDVSFQFADTEPKLSQPSSVSPVNSYEKERRLLLDNLSSRLEEPLEHNESAFDDIARMGKDELLSLRNRLIEPYIQKSGTCRDKRGIEQDKGSTSASALHSGPEKRFQIKHDDESTSYIEECINDTVIETSKSFTAGRKFNYHEFQTAIRLQFRREENTWLRSALLNGNHSITQKCPTRKEITKEFTALYGPVDKDDSQARLYLERYMEWREESVERCSRKQEFLKKTGKKFGKKIALSTLRHGTSRRKKNLKDKQEIYDMNPFTNPSHSDWFLIPRNRPQLENFFIRQRELEEKLAEYQPAPDQFLITGYWPSMFDVRVSSINDQFCFSTDAIMKSIENGLDITMNYFGWESLYHQINNEIKSHPLGICLPWFCDDLMKKHRRLPSARPMIQETIKSLPDICITVNRGQEDNEYDIIVFPTILRDFIDESRFRHILARLQQRILLVLKLHGGKVYLNRVRQLLQCYFGTSPEWDIPKPADTEVVEKLIPTKDLLRIKRR